VLRQPQTNWTIQSLKNEKPPFVPILCLYSCIHIEPSHRFRFQNCGIPNSIIFEIQNRLHAPVRLYVFSIPNLEHPPAQHPHHKQCGEADLPSCSAKPCQIARKFCRDPAKYFKPKHITVKAFARAHICKNEVGMWTNAYLLLHPMVTSKRLWYRKTLISQRFLIVRS